MVEHRLERDELICWGISIKLIKPSLLACLRLKLGY